jgi:hypothetical protein
MIHVPGGLIYLVVDLGRGLSLMCGRAGSPVCPGGCRFHSGGRVPRGGCCGILSWGGGRGAGSKAAARSVAQAQSVGIFRTLLRAWRTIRPGAAKRRNCSVFGSASLSRCY